MLDLLSDGEGRPMGELSDATRLPPANTTRLIDRMTSANLVHRRTDAEDRRRVLIFLAPQGKKRFATLAPIVEKSYADLSPEVANELALALARIVEFLSGAPVA